MGPGREQVGDSGSGPREDHGHASGEGGRNRGTLFQGGDGMTLNELLKRRTSRRVLGVRALKAMRRYAAIVANVGWEDADKCDVSLFTNATIEGIVESTRG